MSKLSVLNWIDPVENEPENMPPAELASVSQRVDRIIYLLEGEKDVPGLVARVALVEELLLGRQGKDGMAHQVRTMWRLHVWFLVTLSAAVSSALTLLIQKIIH